MKNKPQDSPLLGWVTLLTGIITVGFISWALLIGFGTTPATGQPATQITQTTHPPVPHPVMPVIHPTILTYTVKQGDTLWGIAGHVYRNPLKWGKLYALNHHAIGRNPSLIHPGLTLLLE